MAPSDPHHPRPEETQAESHPFKAGFHSSEDGTPGYLSVESGYIIPSGFVGGFDAILPKFAGQDLQDQHHTSDLTHIVNPPVGDYYIEATGEWRTLGYDGDNKNEMFEPHTAEIKHHSQLDLTHEKKRALKLFRLESDGRVSQFIKSDIPMSLGRTAPAIPPWEEPPPEGSDSDSSASSSSSSSGSVSRSWYVGSDSSSGSEPRKWATFRDHEYPAEVYPGITSNVQVSLRNDGNIPWETSDQLLPRGYTWGVSSVPVPITYPGVTRDFNFSITAPMSPGVYSFSWQLYGAGVFFGEASHEVNIQVLAPVDSSSSAASSSGSSSGPPPYDRATYVSQHVVPEEMYVGEETYVSLTFRNTGTTTWQPTTYRLLPQGHHWEMFEISVPSVTPPGVDRTFDATMTAPWTPGTYDWCWMMYGPNGLFEQAGPSVPVIVSPRPVVPPDSSSSSGGSSSGPPPPSDSGSGSGSGVVGGSGSTPSGDNARFVYQIVPEELTQGSTTDVEVTVRNIGSTSWAIPTHRLVSKIPDENSFWGMSEVPMSLPTYSGGERTFYFTITAPETTGLVPFRWQMHSSAEDLFFGDLTPQVNILVTERSSGSSSSS